jgi:FeS assembly SUF system protein
MSEQQSKSFVEIQNEVIEVLKDCYDPEIPVNIYELGLIYEVNVDAGNNVHVLMTLTSPMCPVAESLPPEIEEKIKKIEGLGTVKVEVTFDPPWDQSMMSEGAKLELGML